MILNMLHDSGKVMIAPLVEAFGVSDVSIRKDLAVLEERQLLVRVKGGAIVLRPGGEKEDISISRKQKLHAREKEMLGRYAASLIKEDETIIIDSGTTMMELARNLDQFQNLTIITNSLDIAIILNGYERFNVIVLGGTIRAVSHSTVGMMAEWALKNFYCDKLFLGVDSFSVESGLSTPNVEEASTNQVMISRASEVIAVFDSSKVGKRALAFIASVDKLNTIITDSGFPANMRNQLKSMNVNVETVDL